VPDKNNLSRILWGIFALAIAVSCLPERFGHKDMFVLRQKFFCGENSGICSYDCQK